MRRLFIWGMMISLMGWMVSGCAHGPDALNANAVKPVQAKEKSMEDKKVELGEQGTAFLAWCDGKLDTTRKLMAELKSASQSSTNLEALDVLGRFNQMEMALDDVMGKAGLYQMTHPDAGIRQAGLQAEMNASELATELLLDKDLYQVIAAISDTDPALQAADKRYLEKVLLDFRRNGVDKDEATRQRIRELNQQITEVSQTFQKNLSEDTRYLELTDVADLDGLPQDYIDGHKADEKGVIRLSTDWPDYFPLMTYANKGEVRERMWRLHMQLGYPQNTKVFADLLKLRHELATILGYPTFAAYSMEKMMIKTPDKARTFIDKAAELARKSSEEDKAILLERKKKDEPDASQIMPWEHTYYTRLVKTEKFQFDPEAARKYFDLNKVQKGLLDLSSQLYGITFKPNPETKVWHEDVQPFDVLEDGTLVGRIYLDLYPRENKYKHFAMFSIVSGVKGERVPEGAIVGNFSDPKKSEGPTLIDHNDVTTFFHEFGHLLHHILAGRKKYARFSGTATEWDFVEVPSQLYEEWTWDAEILARFATNEQGEAIPADLVQRMAQAKDFAKGLFVRQQMYYAALSFNLYAADPASFNPDDVSTQMANTYSPWPVIPDTHMIEGFGHLVGYASNYYTYMWSLMIVKDLYEAFKQAGMNNHELALKYRNTILEGGGSSDAADQVRAFLGRDYDYKAFENWLAE